MRIGLLGGDSEGLGKAIQRVGSKHSLDPADTPPLLQDEDELSAYWADQRYEDMAYDPADNGNQGS